MQPICVRRRNIKWFLVLCPEKEKTSKSQWVKHNNAQGPKQVSIWQISFRTGPPPLFKLKKKKRIKEMAPSAFMAKTEEWKAGE